MNNENNNNTNERFSNTPNAYKKLIIFGFLTIIVLSIVIANSFIR